MKNTIKEIIKRFRSWATWVAVAGALWMLFSAFGLPQKWGLTNDTWNAVLNAIGVLLTAFGIVNNPTNREGF